MTRKSLNPLRLSVLLLGGAALSLGTGLALSTASNGNEKQNAPLHVQVDNSPLAREVKDGSSFAPIVKQVAPSVVKVSVTMKTSDNPMSNSDNPGQQHGPMEHGLGSGVIVSPDGWRRRSSWIVRQVL
jgi:serine protease Do